MVPMKGISRHVWLKEYCVISELKAGWNLQCGIIQTSSDISHWTRPQKWRRGTVNEWDSSPILLEVNSLKLSAEKIETILYDWISKKVGTVKDSDAELTLSLWTYSDGSKASTDNQSDAKLIVRLAWLLNYCCLSSHLDWWMSFWYWKKEK